MPRDRDVLWCVGRSTIFEASSVSSPLPESGFEYGQSMLEFVSEAIHERGLPQRLEPRNLMCAQGLTSKENF